MTRIYMLSMMLIFLCMSTNAQRNCSSMDVLDRQILESPKLQDKMQRIENATTAYLKKNRTQRVNGIVTIPVVVHVVYNGSTENISTAQINSQIQILNDDFRRMNSDADNTWSQAADSEFEFCLASVDPNGNATSGITRTSTTRTSFGTNDQVKSSSSGGVNAWPASDYLNIWVCDIGGGILGYAQFPGGSPATDGVVNDYRYFGNTGTATAPFDLGRTLTHEVGHYLNLRHIWGDGGCSVDDFVSDTPVSDASNGGCNEGHISCGTVDMVQNYMDYSNDACMNLFTTGQKARMRALFDPGGARVSLLSSGACGAPPTPTCSDGIQNGNETGVDCGGPDCAPCQSGCSDTEVTVTINLDNYPEETSWQIRNSSNSVVASGGTYGNQADGSTVTITECLADGCYDFIISDAYGDGICCSYGNGSYSVAAGGSTLAAGGSFGNSETTNFCLGTTAPTCSDGVQNGNETGVDCGGPDCAPCVTPPTCSDGIQNGNETGIDCGGPDCAPCVTPPTCDDGIQNGNETGVDCGGPDCAPCNTGGCTETNIDFNDFEAGFGVWNDGGSDCFRSQSSANANSGTRTIRLRDNTSSSTTTTDNLALAGYEEVTIDFTYIAQSMENGEDFWLQASTNGGSSYQTLTTWARGTDFSNNSREFESVTITGNFTNTTRFRFRCDASSNSDWIYLDDINISGCVNGNREVPNTEEAIAELSGEVLKGMNIFPNPTSDVLNVNYFTNDISDVQISILDIAGKSIRTSKHKAEKGQNSTTMQVNDLNGGIYYLQINTQDQQIVKKFVVIE